LTSLVRKYFTPAVQQRIRDNLVNTLTTSQTDFFEKKGPATVYSIKYEWSVPAKQFEWGRLSGGVIPTQEQLELFKKGDFGNPELAKILDNNTRELLKSAYNSGNPAPLVAVNTLEVDPASNQRAMELIKWVNAASTEEERARRVEEAKTDSQLRRLAAEVVGRTVNLTVNGREYEGLVVDVAQIGHGLEMLGLLPQDEVGLGTKFTVDIVNSDFAKKMGVTYDENGVPQHGIADITLQMEQQSNLSFVDRVKNSFAKIINLIPVPENDVIQTRLDNTGTAGFDITSEKEISESPAFTYLNNSLTEEDADIPYAEKEKQIYDIVKKYNIKYRENINTSDRVRSTVQGFYNAVFSTPLGHSETLKGLALDYIDSLKEGDMVGGIVLNKEDIGKIEEFKVGELQRIEQKKLDKEKVLEQEGFDLQGMQDKGYIFGSAGSLDLYFGEGLTSELLANIYLGDSQSDAELQARLIEYLSKLKGDASVLENILDCSSPEECRGKMESIVPVSSTMGVGYIGFQPTDYVDVKTDLGRAIKINPLTWQKFLAANEEFKKSCGSGCSLEITSAYRSPVEQEAIQKRYFKNNWATGLELNDETVNKVSDLLDGGEIVLDNKSIIDIKQQFLDQGVEINTDAIKKGLRGAADPGYSEHHQNATDIHIVKTDDDGKQYIEWGPTKEEIDLKLTILNNNDFSQSFGMKDPPHFSDIGTVLGSDGIVNQLKDAGYDPNTPFFNFVLEQTAREMLEQKAKEL